MASRLKTKSATVVELKRDLANLKAKTIGNKSVIEKRLKLWQENNLNRVIVDVSQLPTTTDLYPANSELKPLKNINKKSLQQYSWGSNYNFVPRKISCKNL